MRKLFALLLFLFIVIGCTEKHEDYVRDIIPPVKLIAGKSKVVNIADLFFLKNYTMQFLKSDDIEVEFNKSTKEVVFKSGLDKEGLYIVNFFHEQTEYAIPVVVKNVSMEKFEYTPKKKYNVLTLFGSFNGWNRQQLPLKDENKDGKYEIEIPLESGRYEYKFYGDGEEIIDPNNKVSVPNGLGGFNSVLVVKDKHPDKLFLHKDSSYTISTGSEYIFAIEGKDLSTLHCDNVFVLLDNERLSAKEVVCYDNKVKVFLDNYQLKESKLLRVAVSVNGQVSNMQTVVLDKDYMSWYDATIYSLMVDRFNDGDDKNNNPVVHDSLSDKANYMGGDLQGVINKLHDGYFNKLGINTLWISPVYANPNEAFKEYPAPYRYYSGYHGYWPSHHIMVEEHFGDMKKLQELVKVAHERDVKVLLDFVSNHVHEQHPFYKNHRDWFGKLELPDGSLNLRMWDEHRLTTWFEPYLPSFDYESSDEAVEAMTDNAIWWLKTSGADGFRHDAVKHVPNKFWRRLTQKIKEEIEIPENVMVYQIGETFGDYNLVSSYVNPGQLTSQFNFEVYNVAQGVFVSQERSFQELANELKKTEEVYGSIHFMGNIMDSHDKDRFMAAADGDLVQNQNNSADIGWTNPPIVDNPYNYKKAECYYAFMFSIPGIPVVYYGSEFGMTGAADPDNRRMMRFDNQLSEGENNLLHKVMQISKLRMTNRALRTGDLYMVKSDKDIFAYIRSDFNERVLVVINKNLKPLKTKLEIPGLYSITKAVDMSNGDKHEVGNSTLDIEIEDYSWKMFSLM